MKKKESQFQPGAVRYLLFTLISMAAGIASAGLFFAKWLRLAGTEYSVPQFYQAATNLQSQLQDWSQQFASITSIQVPVEIPELDQVRIGALVFMALAAILVLLQVVYVFKILFGNGGRGVGITAGLLTAVLSLVVVALLFWTTGQLNEQLAPVNEALNTLATAYDGLSGVLQNALPSVDLSALHLDANELIQVTVFPYVTAVLGVVEAIFAR